MKKPLTQTFLEEQISNIDKTIDALEEQRNNGKEKRLFKLEQRRAN
jgi:hypothetical protein